MGLISRLQEAARKAEQNKRDAEDRLIEKRKASLPTIARIAKKHGVGMEAFDKEARLTKNGHEVYVAYGTEEPEIHRLIKTKLEEVYKSSTNSKFMSGLSKLADKLEDVRDGYDTLDEDIKALDSKKTAGFWDNKNLPSVGKRRF